MLRTVNYDLCQYEGSDKTSYLVNYNGDMLKIDTAIKNAADAASTAQGTATQASNKADSVESSVTSLNNQINGAGGLAVDVVSLQGSVNTINSLIGTGEPTTTNKTLIGAINEINAKDGELSDLTTTDKTSLVAAINEVAGGQGGTVDADDVTYDNTTSGLLATNVQDAIDEVAAAIPSGGGYHVITNTITNESTSAWGNMFVKFVTVDITSLGLQSAPTKIVPSFVASDTQKGFALIGSVTASSVEIGVATNSAVTGQLSGEVIAVIYD